VKRKVPWLGFGPDFATLHSVGEVLQEERAREELERFVEEHRP
jgi:hypothetical protein